MLKFRSFLSGQLDEVAIKSGINDKHTKRHIEKYLNPNWREEHRYEVNASDHPVFEKGSRVRAVGEPRVGNPKKREDPNHYYVDAQDPAHPERQSSIKLSHLEKPAIGRAGKDQEKLERSQIDHLQNAIQAAIKANRGKPIRMHVGGGKHVEVDGIKKVEGEKPKADAYLHDKAGNKVHWMSLKGKQFQQFGGTKGLEKHPSMMRALEHLKNARETFHSDSRGKYTNNPVLPTGHAYHVNLDHANNLEDRDLIHKEMYGLDHGKEHGKNNVHAIYGGDTINIKKTNHPDGNVYEFDPDAVYSNMHNNSDSDVADAKVLVTPREEKNQHGTGGRVMVAPTYLSPNSKDAVEALRTGVGYVKAPRKNASKKVPTSSVGGMDFRSPVEREEHA
jgi:hypothetical protein